MPPPPSTHILFIGLWGGLVQGFVPYCGTNGFGFLLTNGFVPLVPLVPLVRGVFRTVLVGG